MPLLCGLCFRSQPADLSREEVADLFTLSTKINEGRLIVHGLFARADTKNTNGRTYPKSILKREVSRFQCSHIRTGTALGELNHPSYCSSYFRSLNLPNISHQVLEVNWRGKELWGTIEVLPTPAGLLLWELYSRGIKLGVSSRGWASVVADPSKKQVLVDDDFQLITFDFVTEPSNAGAYLVPIKAKYKKPLPDQSRAVKTSYLGFGSSDMTQLDQLPAAAVLSKWLKQTRKEVAAAAAAAKGDAGQVLVRAGEQPSGLSATTTLQQPSAAAVACSTLPGSEEAASSSTPDGLTAAGGGESVSHAASSMLQVLGKGRLAVSLPGHTPLGGDVVLGCHYHVLQEPWMPMDPAGREFKVHLSLVATKAHLMQNKQQSKQDIKQQAKKAWAAQQQQQGLRALQAGAAQQDGVTAGQGPLPQDDSSSSSIGHNKQQQQQQERRSTLPGQLEQAAARESMLHTTSTGGFSNFSNGSLGSQHLAAAREVLLCTTSTDMSGCSLGPLVPPAAAQQQQQQQPLFRQRVASRRQHTPAVSSLQPLQQPLQQLQQQQPFQQPLVSLQPFRWEQQQQQVLTSAQPSALHTVPVGATGVEAAVDSCSSNEVQNVSTVADMLVAANGSAAVAAAAAAAAKPGTAPPAPCHVDVQVPSDMKGGCAAAVHAVQQKVENGSSDSCSSGRIAAWHDSPAGQQQQQVQEEASDQQPCSLDGEYLDIRQTLQAYQNEFRRQRKQQKHDSGCRAAVVS